MFMKSLPDTEFSGGIHGFWNGISEVVKSERDSPKPAIFHTFN